MKLVLHFDSMHAELDPAYGSAANQLAFSELLALNALVVSEIVAGDLLFGQVEGLKYGDAFARWFRPPRPVWARASEGELMDHTAIHAIGFGNIDEGLADQLHKRLGARSASYIAAMEVDETYHVHQALWSMLLPMFRINGRAAHAFWDGDPAGDRDELFVEQLQELGFDPVTWEVRL